MPCIPRGGQIVTLHSAKQGAAALANVHLAIYLSFFPIYFSILPWIRTKYVQTGKGKDVLICKDNNPAEINIYKCKKKKKPAKGHIFVEIDKSKCYFLINSSFSIT